MVDDVDAAVAVDIDVAVAAEDDVDVDGAVVVVVVVDVDVDIDVAVLDPQWQCAHADIASLDSQVCGPKTLPVNWSDVCELESPSADEIGHGKKPEEYGTDDGGESQNGSDVVKKRGASHEKK